MFRRSLQRGTGPQQLFRRVLELGAGPQQLFRRFLELGAYPNCECVGKLSARWLRVPERFVLDNSLVGPTIQPSARLMPTSERYRPLHALAMIHWVSGARLLLQYGANVNCFDSEGWTAMDPAVSYHHFSLDHGFLFDAERYLPLRLEMALLLLDAGGRCARKRTFCRFREDGVDFEDRECRAADIRLFTRQDLNELKALGLPCRGATFEPTEARSRGRQKECLRRCTSAHCGTNEVSGAD